MNEQSKNSKLLFCLIKMCKLMEIKSMNGYLNIMWSVEKWMTGNYGS